MRIVLTMSAAVAVLTLSAGLGMAEGVTAQQLQAAARRTGSVNGLCPVMGKLVTPKGGSAIYDGEKIAFCCPPCAAKFRADPTRFMDRMRVSAAKYGYASQKPSVALMKKAKAATRTANGRCPVMGKPVTVKGGVVTHGEQRIGFCCPPCAEKFRADPKRYMRTLRADPLAYLYDRPGPTNAELRTARTRAGTVNGLCPVMGNLVQPNGGSVVYKGEKIGFCCPGCDAKFRKNPESYVTRMRSEAAVYGYVPAAPRTSR